MFFFFKYCSLVFFLQLEMQANQCRKCKRQKILRKSSGSCRVCGLALCKRCSSKDLLLYYTDDPKKHLPLLAIVNENGVSDNYTKQIFAVCLQIFFFYFTHAQIRS